MRLKLVLRNLLAHPLRALLTVASLTAAVFLLCTLQTAVRVVTAGVEAAAANRLVVQSAVSLFVSLPLSYQAKIAQVPGVERVTKWTWFGGVYQDPSNFFGQFAVDPDRLLEMYPEIRVAEGSYEDFEGDRRGALLGRSLAERYGWSVGETVPLIGTIYPRPGDQAWEFQVRALYETDAANIGEETMFFHHEYLEETQRALYGDEGLEAGVYIVRMRPGAEPTAVMRGIDELFEAGPQRVQTTTEAEFNRQFSTMLGNIPMLLSSIGGGVLFAILLGALNTMLMAGRERTRQIGILKSLGFGDGTPFAMLLAEGLLLCGLGSVLGVGLALVTEPGISRALGTMFPGYRIVPGTLVLGLAIGPAVGLLAALLPALAARRLRPVEALRRDA